MMKPLPLALLCTTLLSTTAAAADRDTILETLEADDRLSTLSSILEDAGLTETLSGKGPFTLYAPSDAAFENLPTDLLSTLLLDENADRLSEIVLYHVDDRKLTSRHLVPGAAHYRPLLSDAQLCITNMDGITIADSTPETAAVIQADIKAANGVIHVIDKVLIPGDAPACHS